MKASDITLVITVALKKELPQNLPTSSGGIQVHTLASVKSGSLNRLSGLHPGMFVLVTGAGPEASKHAACWIRDNLDPGFVLNIGTCGLIGKKHRTGQWILPQAVSDENGNRLRIDTRLPVPAPGPLSTIPSLVSCRKPVRSGSANTTQGQDAVDMECYAQARVFEGTRTDFHCLKFATDHSDQNTESDFNRNLRIFRKELMTFFGVITQHQQPPKISVVMPVFNRCGLIARALDSVIHQSHPPDQIIVVDDGSTDSTRHQLQHYGERITAIYLNKNSGPSRARNTGVSHATSDWIAFLDSDDCWKRDKLKNQITFLRRYPFYQILQSDEIWIRNGKRVNPCMHHAKPSGWIWDASLERCLVSPSGVLIKKSLFEQYGGFDESLPVCEDYDLWLRISRHHPVGLEPSLSVVKYGGHADQLSRTFVAIDRFRVHALKGCLEREADPVFRGKIIRVIEKKMKILIGGYEKRGNTAKAQNCRDMLCSLSE